MSEKTKTAAEYIFFRQTIVKSNFLLVQVLSMLLVIYLLIMGVYIYSSGSSLFEHKERIDHSCREQTCEVTVRVDKKIVSGPLYLYIGFEGFYVNHRKVLYSIDYDQLGGSDMTMEQLKTHCDGYRTIEDLKRFHSKIDTSGYSYDEIVNPCGLFAFLYTRCNVKR